MTNSDWVALAILLMFGLPVLFRVVEYLGSIMGGVYSFLVTDTARLEKAKRETHL